MKFKRLCAVFQQIEATTSGNKMRQICADFFKTVPKTDMGLVCHLMLGEIAPEYEGIPLGMADKRVVKAIAKAAKKDEAKIKDLLKKKGDIGLVAETLIANKGALEVKQVFTSLTKIAKSSGPGSQDLKTSELANILKKSTSLEAKYLSRIVVGTLRLGASRNTIMDALAIAFTGSKANKKQIESAYIKNPDMGTIAETIAKTGLKKVEKTAVVVFRPIRMMLCQRIKKLEELKQRMELIGVEDKMDGERIQAHKQGNKIQLFSRRMENITSQFPDVVEACRKNVKGNSYIIEGEVLPIDKKGKVLPFQLLMQRRRKYRVEEYVKKIPVTFFLFELLYLNGKSYINTTYTERRKTLKKIVKSGKHICLIKRIETKDLKKIQNFFTESLKRGSEGIVAKSCSKESIYKPGARGYEWIKWKKEYVAGMQDTFDLVVIGAFYGKGKRANVYGALLCAAYNITKKRFESFCKLGSGFTDKNLAKLPKKLKKYETKAIPKNVLVHKKMKADVWFKPVQVVEVLGAEVTRSPLHTTNIQSGKGLALRFPRFVRYRPDKKPKQATSVKEIKQLAK